MTLLELLKSKSEAELDDFAQRCQTTAKYLIKVARGYSRVGTSLAINIERESGGIVRCEDLRVDVDWAYIRSAKPKKSKAAAKQRGATA